jgi:Ca2+:H+ antiporter
MTLLLPAAFFAALNHGSSAAPEAESFINDTNRHVFLQMSRGLAVILLTVLVT